MAVQWLDLPVDITPASGGWQDADLSAHVPADAAGVIVRVVNNVEGNRQYGVRKNGSTDNYAADIDNHGQLWDVCGIGGDGLIEVYSEDLDVTLQLTGYFAGGAVFFTNAVNKGSLTLDAQWEDVDISADTGSDIAIAALGMFLDTSPFPAGVRKNGSTDHIVHNGIGRVPFAVGVDGSEVFEAFVNNPGGVDVILAGYLTGGWTFHTNWIDASPSAADAWENHDLAAAGAAGGIIVAHASAAEQYGARKNGSALAWNGRTANEHGFAIVAADGGVIETYRSSSNVSLFEAACAEAAGGTGGNADPAGIAAVGAIGDMGIAIDAVVLPIGLAASGAAGLPAASNVQDAMAVPSGPAIIGVAGMAMAGSPWRPLVAPTAIWSETGAASESWTKITPASGAWNR